MPADLLPCCERTCGIYLDETVFTSHTSFVAVSTETLCNHFETKRTALESTANLMLLLRLMGNEFSGQLPRTATFSTLAGLTNVILFCTELISDFRVSLYQHQAFDSKGDEKIYSLEFEETTMLHNEEQIFTIQQMWCCALK